MKRKTLQIRARVWIWVILICLIEAALTAEKSLAAPAAAGSVLHSVALATYVPSGHTQTETIYSNRVDATIAAIDALSLTQSQSVARPAGATATLSHVLTNTGNTTSSYFLNWSNGGDGCSGANYLLSGLRVVRDVNANGVVDAGEPPLALNSANSLTLNPGESAVLLVQGAVPSGASGTACLNLKVVSGTQAVSASNVDTISAGNTAVFALTKSASIRGGIVVPGNSRVDFTVKGVNIGTQPVQATGTAAAGATPITVNGTPASLILLRDQVPAGTQYIMGSLQSSATNALKLFRLPGDAPFAYRAGSDDASAVEVAIGIPSPSVIVPNASIQMQFAVNVLSGAAGGITNLSQAYYNDGTQAVVSPSNTVVIPISSTRLGVANAASSSILNADGAANETEDVTFSVRVKNYGTEWLYDLALLDVLEGNAATQFGTYVSTAIPAANQFAIVPGSLRMSQPNGGVRGTVGAVNPGFSGTASNANLLAPGAVLPPGGEFTVQFAVRFHLAGRAGTLYNLVKGQAAIAPGGAASVFDDSVDGTDPDPDADGNPHNNGSPTPIATQLPGLSIAKTVSLPRRVGDGTFDLDFTFLVTNTGQAMAPNIRVLDNLNCAFDMDLPTGQIASWRLQSPVRSAKGILSAATAYTGNAACDRSRQNSADPYQIPTESNLSLVEGNHSLAPGQSEQLAFTVRVTEKPNIASSRVAFTNKAWAASLSQNSLNVTPSMVLAAAASSATGMLMDPQGTVYDSVTRQPIAGAIVTLSRQSCTGGMSTVIQPDEILEGNSGTYTYGAKGSVSMVTGAAGTWQFAMLSTPASSKCTYTLTVTPPAGSGYVYPSQRIPSTAGVFSSCGAIVPHSGPPKGSDPTTYYTSIVMGPNGDGTHCNAEHLHIPLDAGSQSGLVLRKDGSKKQVDFGDFLDFALTVTNKTGAPITGVTFTDTLPPGFAYVSGSSRLNGAVGTDPQGGAGPKLVWSLPTAQLAVDQSLMVRYRIRVGVGARISGNATNRAMATSGVLQSNQATFTVRVNGEVFSDEAYAFGKVFMDCNRDRMHSGADEIGVPGVRLWLEDGTNVVTDGEGKWSLYGLRPQTHVLRVDETTLPMGVTLELLDNRNADNPASRFLDLKNGEFQKANFPLLGCQDPKVMKDVRARRALVDKRADAEGEAMIRARLDPQNRVAAPVDTRGMPASGQINGAGAGASQPQSSGSLIQLPAGASGANDSFINGTGSASGMTGTLGSAKQMGFAPGRDASGAMAGSPVSSALAGTGNADSTVSAAQNSRLAPNATPLFPQGAPGVIELETLLPSLDSAPGFLELKDHDTVLAQSINVRVKGPAGTVLRLSVNGVAIDSKRVGKKATLGKTGTTAWEYIGVTLKPGINRLRLEVVDEFGIVRAEPQEIAITAPDKLGQILVDVPTGARADLRTPVPVIVRLTDATGVPITARTQLTLEADAGRWQEDDLNSSEPGHQVFLDGGEGTYHLIPPGTPGDVRIRVSASEFVKDVRLSLLPDLRPMIAVGVVEGTFDLSRRGTLAVGQIPAGAAFEQELAAVGDADSDNRLGGRAAFFLKGAIKGEYLLTAALDTGKSSQQRLFRDIRPDEFYPIYGDASVRGFDAQSSQRLYVRIDKGRSYLLYGDFTSASSEEVRKLSQTNRTLTGLKSVYQTEDMRVTSYVSRTAQTQEIDEFPANGTSGPYYLSVGSGGFVENSEIVEVIIRDRSQPNLILQRTTMTRFVDYTIEPLSGRLLFTHPIASADASLNPQSIRVTLEVDSGGAKYTVAGVDAQFKVRDNLQLGVVANTDEDPRNRHKLAAVTGLARVDANTSVAAEVVRTDSDLKGSGGAGRIEVRHQDEALAVTGQIARSSISFDNPAAGFAAGRTEGSARAEYRVDPTLAVRSEALYSKDALTEGATRGVTSSLLKRFNDILSAEVGLRYGVTSSTSTASLFNYSQVSSYNGAFGSSQTGSSVTTLGSVANAANGINSSQNSLTTLRGRLTANVPNVPQAQVFVEGEQDLREGNRHMAAVGGSYALTDRTRLYGRYELVSSLFDFNAQQTRNTAIFGIESSYMEGGRVYNEYRLADALDGRTAQDAIGVRNTVKLGEHWRLTGGVERTRVIGGVSDNGSAIGLGDSTAVTSGVEYLSDRVKFSGVLEGRHGSDANTVLNSMGWAYKLNSDLSILARGIYSSSRGNGAQEGNERTLSRQQVGIAYRPVDEDVWNVLTRYEHRTERIRGNGTAVGAISSNVFGSSVDSMPGNYEAQVVSTNVNLNPKPGEAFMGRLASKILTHDDGVLKSTYSAHLLQGRWTHDINRKWDIGVQAALLRGSGGALQRSAGLEVGYLIMKDLWFSIGYNFVGLSDPDLTDNDYTSKGVYARLRFKFDETNLGFARTGSAQGAPDSARIEGELAGAERSQTIVRASTLFEPSQATLTTQGRAELDALLPRLVRRGDDVDLVKGCVSNCDSQTLFNERLRVVQAYLHDGGVSDEHLRVVDDQPVDLTQTVNDLRRYRVRIDVVENYSKNP
ncbi:DUF11 domain-containing protein [Ralstonia sp. UBA689]|uniref:DUF11 domain-containing protein n=1 Tax=Ralstonia sp. UBA689 TaxID=1947373 RepID=UPI0025E7F4E8|nr:DUF11 domain-containing protein [Ralstonia sp. UBA689]